MPMFVLIILSMMILKPLLLPAQQFNIFKIETYRKMLFLVLIFVVSERIKKNIADQLQHQEIPAESDIVGFYLTLSAQVIIQKVLMKM